MGRGKSKQKQKVSQRNAITHHLEDTRTEINEKSLKEGPKSQEEKHTLGQEVTVVASEKNEKHCVGDSSLRSSALSDTIETPSLGENKDQEDSEIWDLIRVVAEEKAECRCDHCKKQAVAIWASDKNPDDTWPVCEACQLVEFGGWPEDVEATEIDEELQGVDDIPKLTSTNEENLGTATQDDQNDQVLTSPNSSLKKSVLLTPPPSKRTSNQGQKSSDETNDVYELTKVIPLERLQKNAVKCHYENCSLPACVIYTCPLKDKKWYYCIDCQEIDFGGWPPEKDIPCDHLKPDHLQFMAAKCSKKRNPKMPVLDCSHCVTPMSKSPKPPGRGGSLPQIPLGKNKPSKLSAAFVARHEKWQADAKKLGVNRIIVKKGEAKKVVFDTLYDAFRPMNFNDIYTALKKMIPPPVLKVTLEDMSMDFRDDGGFARSDSEDDNTTEPKIKVKEPYAGSLKFKAGKSVSSQLYYTDYTKMKEMDIQARQDLMNKVVTAKAEYDQLSLKLNATIFKTNQLLSEPTNDKLIELLSASEHSVTELTKQIDDAKALMINESHRKKLKRRIQSMAGQYRKRKNLCCSFLSCLEEVSDGTISKKKCLNGDGQIALDSDESVNRSAIAYAKSKKRQKVLKESLADKNFVGVRLDNQGMINRVYIDGK